MHSVLWASILASAGVALVTTLAIEYFAKPRLEARKDRILESSREKRAALKAIQQALSLSRRLQAYKGAVPDQLPMEYLCTISGQVAERIDTADESQVLMSPASLDDCWARIAAVFSTFAFAVQVGRPPAESWKALESVIEELDIFYQYFRTPKWRMQHRRRLINEILSYPHFEDTDEVLED